MTWFDVIGWEDRYQITRSGVVRSKSRLVNSPAAGGQRRIRGRVLKVANVKGYFAIQPSVCGAQKTLYVHRMIADLFVPNPDKLPCVNHKDGNKTNNSPHNLEWCTHQQNMAHAFRTGLVPYPKTGPGEQSPAAKLTNDKVKEIKRRLLSGETQKSLAKEFEVSAGTIGFIARGETWSHIEP